MVKVWDYHIVGFLVILLFISISVKASEPTSLQTIFNGKITGDSIQDSNMLSLIPDSYPTYQFDEVELMLPSSQKLANIKEIENAFKENEQVRVLVWVKKGENYKKVIKSLKDLQIIYEYESSNGFATVLSRQQFTQLKRNHLVDYLALDQEVSLHLAQSVSIINATVVQNPSNNDYNLTGRNVGVCILDTGINYNHSALSAGYIGGYDLVNNDPFPYDDNGHGTKVAGIIGSKNSLNKGVSPDARLVVVKVLDSGALGFTSTIAAGIDWCVNHKSQYNISVISMSLGSGIYNPSTNPGIYEPSLLNAYNNNIAVVASSGNDGSTTGIAYPAISPYVISVGATYDANLGSVTTPGVCTDTTTSADKVTCYSNRAPFLDLMAPGTLITTTTMAGGFSSVTGTSMSAPHVSGVIALMNERNPNMLPAQVKNILNYTGKSLLDTSTSLNFRRVNALNAVDSTPYITKSGTFTALGVINFTVHDTLNPGNVYVLALGLTTTPGTPLPDGRIVPVNLEDPVLQLSLQNPTSIGLVNSVSTLDSNGLGVATFSLPNIPGLSSYTVYAVFVTVDPVTGNILSVSSPRKL